MTLSEAIARLDQFEKNATLYVEGPPDSWTSTSRTAAGIEDVEAEVETLPPEAEALTYFLEVSIALEVLEGWASHLGHDPTLDEKIDRIIYYARFDA